MSTKQSTSIVPVVKIVTLECSQRTAFRCFTEDFGLWWPSETHSVTAFASGYRQKPLGVRFECRKGGRISETVVDSFEHPWGSILAWEPPSRVLFTWHPARRSDTSQLVEVRFNAIPQGTVAVLVQSGWERLGVHGPQEREWCEVGWEQVFGEAFGKYVMQVEHRSYAEHAC